MATRGTLALMCMAENYFKAQVTRTGCSVRVSFSRPQMEAPVASPPTRVTPHWVRPPTSPQAPSQPPQPPPRPSDGAQSDLLLPIKLLPFLRRQHKLSTCHTSWPSSRPWEVAATILFHT